MAQTSANEISVVNDALALVGHDAISAFDGLTPASEVSERLFNLVLGRLLSAYPWRFAIQQKQLARNGDVTPVGWDYAHALPVDRDGIPRRYYANAHGSIIGDWEIFGDNVLTDHEIVYCDYVTSRAYAGTFRDLLVRALAADLAISLCDDRGLKDRYQSEAFGTPREGGRGGLFKTAISTDAAGAGPRQAFTIGRGPLVDAHNGQSSHRGNRANFGSWT